MHKDQLTFVDTVLQGCAAILANRPKASDTKAVKSLVALLVAPLEAYDVVSVLMLGSYPKARGWNTPTHTHTRTPLPTH